MPRKMRVTVSHHNEEGCYKIWLYIEDRKYQFAKDYCYKKDDQHEVWVKCLETARAFENQINRATGKDEP